MSVEKTGYSLEGYFKKNGITRDIRPSETPAPPPGQSALEAEIASDNEYFKKIKMCCQSMLVIIDKN